VRVTIAKPYAKSSTGMSHGKRTPLLCSAAYRTIGAESFVSQPSTSTWNANTMSIATQ